MKLNKFFTSLSALSLCVATTPIVCFTTSCHKKSMTEYENYIYNRSFSIMGINDSSGKCCLGTGWIISDATKTTTDDYVYWLATNWHVIHGMESANKYYYADDSLKTIHSFIDYQNYEEFASFNIENQSNFLYSSETGSTYFKPCVDFYVVKVDFGSPKGKIKSKLDDLNKYNQTNGYINKFVSDSSSIRNKTKYVAGYPMKESSSGSYFGGQWEAHEIKNNSLGFYEYKTCYSQSEYGYDQYGHAVGTPNKDQQGKTITYPSGSTATPEAYYYYDIAPNYLYNYSQALDYMSPGASGSMLITSDFEVCGIYWGGWGDSETVYYPSFSQFMSDKGDFVTPYL